MDDGTQRKNDLAINWGYTIGVAWDEIFRFSALFYQFLAV